MAFDPKNTFILSPNKKGDNPKRPDWRGTVNIDGKEYELAGWTRQKRDGSGDFISGPVKVKEIKTDPGAYQPNPAPSNPAPAPSRPQPSQSTADLDEDLPF
jgi:hypothetical protein